MNLAESPIATHIRPFDQTDQADVRSLILEGLGERFGYIDETLNPDLDDIYATYVANGHRFVVAESAGTIVGTGALVKENRVTGRIVRMSVAGKYRRCGIGQALVIYLLALARERGDLQVLVETNLDWFDAIRLYRRNGFITYNIDEISMYLRRDVCQSAPQATG